MGVPVFFWRVRKEKEKREGRKEKGGRGTQMVRGRKENGEWRMEKGKGTRDNGEGINKNGEGRGT